MQYREIVAVTGLGGLFQLMATKSDGAIVRSLADNTTKFIPSRLHNVTPLESIEIYTHGNNVRLHEVLQKMKESDTERPDAKKGSSGEILAYFKGVFPEMDEDRVYPSDMKKMLKWFEILKGADLLDFSSLRQGATGADSDAPEDAASMPSEGEAQLSEHDKDAQAELPLVEEGDEKPAKKSRAKKAAGTDDEGAPKPAKKAAKKKAEPAEDAEAAPKKAARSKKKEEE